MIQLGTLIVSVLAFLLMFLIIQRFGFKPLGKMLEQRRIHIETQIREAEGSRAHAERLLAEHRQLLDQARNEARDILDAARARSDEQARQIVEAAHEEAERLLADGRQLIERERNEALTSILDRVSALTVELTEKLLQNHVTPALHQDLLKEAEQRVGELS